MYRNAILLEDQSKAKFLNVTYCRFSISLFENSTFRENPFRCYLLTATASDELG